MLATLAGAAFGIAGGIRHALEPDHIVAVSTLIADASKPRTRVVFALWWGCGHGLMLVLVGALLLRLRAAMPETATDIFELAVAATLIVLGAQGLWRARALTRGELAAPTSAAQKPRAKPGLARALAVGIVHGLAGSGALTALAVAQVSTPGTALVFVALYALGAILGMGALAAVAAVPLGRLVAKPRGLLVLLLATGAASIALGVVWGAPIATRLAG